MERGENTERNDLNLGAFQGEIEIYCNGNSMGSMRITVAKIPSNGGHGS